MTARLSRVPNRNNLLRLGGRLAFDLGVLRPGRSLSGCSLTVLRSAVRTHRKKAIG
jgi:hypothetical protein